MCVQGVWEKRPADIHTVMSNFAKLSSSWLVQSIRKVLRMVSVILANVLIVSPLNKNFENKSGWAGPHSSSKFSKFQLDSKYSTVKQSTWSLLLKFLGQRSLVSKTFPLKKNWVLTNFGYKKLWVTDLEKLTMKKQFGSKKISDLTWPVTTWLHLSWLNLTWSKLT